MWKERGDHLVAAEASWWTDSDFPYKPIWYWCDLSPLFNHGRPCSCKMSYGKDINGQHNTSIKVAKITGMKTYDVERAPHLRSITSFHGSSRLERCRKKGQTVVPRRMKRSCCAPSAQKNKNKMFGE